MVIDMMLFQANSGISPKSKHSSSNSSVVYLQTFNEILPNGSDGIIYLLFTQSPVEFDFIYRNGGHDASSDWQNAGSFGQPQHSKWYLATQM